MGVAGPTRRSDVPHPARPQRRRRRGCDGVLHEAARRRAGQDRPGYANFAVAQPPLKLVLLENPGSGGTLNHLGIEVASVDAVDATQTRLAEQGLASVEERGTTCCYATQDKFWVEGAPDGERWEIYTVLADSQTFFGGPGDGPTCCSDTGAGELSDTAQPVGSACC